MAFSSPKVLLCLCFTKFLPFSVYDDVIITIYDVISNGSISRRTRSRSRTPKKRSDAILIRSRSNTPDVKIEVESTNQQTKKFESVNKIKEPEKDVVLVDEIASSAYAKTFYKSKVIKVIIT